MISNRQCKGCKRHFFKGPIVCSDDVWEIGRRLVELATAAVETNHWVCSTCGNENSDRWETDGGYTPVV